MVAEILTSHITPHYIVSIYTAKADNNWYKESIDLRMVNRVEFFAVRAGDSVSDDLGDIAIDSIMVTRGACGSKY